MTDAPKVSDDYITPEAQPDKPGGAMQVVGMVVLWPSLLAMIFTPMISTSVSAPGYGEVQNIGKMQLAAFASSTAAVGIIAGLLLYIGGSIIAEMDRHFAARK